MNQLLYSDKSMNNPIKKIVIVLFILLVIAVIAIFVLINRLDGKILANVYVGDVGVGLYTKDEAQNALTEGMTDFSSNDLNLIYGTLTTKINASDIELKVAQTPEELAKKAYEYGRNSNFFSNVITMIKSYFSDQKMEIGYGVNEEKLTQILENLTSGDVELPGEDTYVISGDSVIIYKGKEGIQIDIELAKKYIITAFENHVASVTLPTKKQESKKVDVQKIFDEVYVAPIDARISSGEKVEIIEQVNGKGFNIENVEKVYASLPANKYMEIKLEEIEPKVKTEDIEGNLFKDVLSSYTTKFDSSDEERVKNLSTAAKKCNGVVLNAGEVFSFAQAVEPITEGNGYTHANGYADGKVESMLGGGICQVSSTIYNTALLSNIEIVERGAHSMAIEYVDPGFDAVYASGGTDLKIKNNRTYPIKILTALNNGKMTVTIKGMKDSNDPRVELESKILAKTEAVTSTQEDTSLKKGSKITVQKAIDGYSVESYKVLKNDKGEEISRELLASNVYAPVNGIVKVGVEVRESTVTPTPVTSPQKTPTTVATKTPTMTPTPTKTITKTAQPPKVTTPKQTVTPIAVIATPVPTPTKLSNQSEDPSIVTYDEEEKTELPSGWDSPESPYGKNR